MLERFAENTIEHIRQEPDILAGGIDCPLATAPSATATSWSSSAASATAAI